MIGQSRCLGAPRFWLAQLSISGIIASGAQADLGRDYNILVLAHVPSLCAMRDVRPVSLSAAAEDGATLRTLEAPKQFRIVCNVPFAVRVGGLQHHKAGTRVSPLSEATPPPLEVSLMTGAGLGAERVACASATSGEASPCMLLGRSAAGGQHMRRPGSWLSIGRPVRAIERPAGAKGEEAADSIASPISVTLSARY